MPLMEPPAVNYLYTEDNNEEICRLLKDDSGLCYSGKSNSIKFQDRSLPEN